MQRVYRGERAQRGRFREFYQCDIDVIGKDALSRALRRRDPGGDPRGVLASSTIGAFTIQLNNRKLMRGFFEGAGRRRRRAAGAGAARGRQARQARRGRTCATTLAGEGFGAGRRGGRAASWRSSQVRSTGHADALAQARRAGRRQRDAATKACAELREVLELVQRAGRAGDATTRSTSRSRAASTTTPAPSTRPRSTSIRRSARSARAAATTNLASHYTKSKLPGVGISIGADAPVLPAARGRAGRRARDSTVQALVDADGRRALPTALDARAASCAPPASTPKSQLEATQAGASSSSTPTAPASASCVRAAATTRSRAASVTVKDLRRAGPVRGAARRTGAHAAGRDCAAGRGAAQEHARDETDPSRWPLADPRAAGRRRHGATVELDADAAAGGAARRRFPRRAGAPRGADLRRLHRLRQQRRQAARRASACATSCRARRARRRHAARGAAAQPDRHPRGLRRRAASRRKSCARCCASASTR